MFGDMVSERGHMRRVQAVSVLRARGRGSQCKGPETGMNTTENSEQVTGTADGFLWATWILNLFKIAVYILKLLFFHILATFQSFISY